MRIVMLAVIGSVAAALSSLGGCQALPGGGGATDRPAFTGTLRGGMMAIGGETTGWVLTSPSGGGADGGELMVDVSAVEADARRLEGSEVVITGEVTERDFVERGATRILIADRIEPLRAADQR